ncbi:MAG TPA: alpha/beta family hydrolase [Candidatus Sulfotelmatobacter sp.]|jgi:predicted alpha/beta-hydrolase family hydrolase|nr:alpha/beta family hydrolase [Candidatus Sulfotelmatobacter sp.]
MAREIVIDAGDGSGEVAGLLSVPPQASHLLVFAHGAGAGMGHPFMESAAAALGAHGIATLRYQFPYMQKKQRRPDPPTVLHATVRAAVRAAATEAPGLSLLAGGKSMGGRMTSQAAASEPLEGVRGLVFFGFPLHPAGKPSNARGAHLSGVAVPMLFLQGTRDRLAELDLLRPLLAALPRATLKVFEGADHSFHLPKSAGHTDDDLLAEIARTVAEWAESAGQLEIR